MRKTIYAKMTALPVGLCALAFAVTSCGSSEYKKFADNEGILLSLDKTMPIDTTTGQSYLIFLFTETPLSGDSRLCQH